MDAPSTAVPGAGHRRAAAVRLHRSVGQTSKPRQPARWPKRAGSCGEENRENRAVRKTVKSRSVESATAVPLAAEVFDNEVKVSQDDRDFPKQAGSCGDDNCMNREVMSPAADVFDNEVEISQDDRDFPEVPSKRMTFIKNDPELVVTPIRRMTFKKGAAVMGNTPVVSPGALVVVSEEGDASQTAAAVAASTRRTLHCPTDLVLLTPPPLPGLPPGGAEAHPQVVSSLHEPRVDGYLGGGVTGRLTPSTPQSPASATYRVDPSSDDSFGRDPLVIVPSPDPPTAVGGVQPRLSSTPVGRLSCVPQWDGRLSARTPSPIIGKRVSSDTVVKRLPPVSPSVLPSWAGGKRGVPAMPPLDPVSPEPGRGARPRAAAAGSSVRRQSAMLRPHGAVASRTAPRRRSGGRVWSAVPAAGHPGRQRLSIDKAVRAPRTQPAGAGGVMRRKAPPGSAKNPQSSTRKPGLVTIFDASLVYCIQKK